MVFCQLTVSVEKCAAELHGRAGILTVFDGGLAIKKRRAFAEFHVSN